MPLDLVATTHTFALFLGSLGCERGLRTDLERGNATVHLFGDVAVPVIRRAAIMLGVDARWKCRDSASYPVEYLVSGRWHGIDITLFTLLTPDEWAAADVDPAGQGAA